MNKKELELYIHIPFCVKSAAIVTFCLALPRSRQGRAYMAALFAEIEGKSKRLQGPYRDQYIYRRRYAVVVTGNRSGS